jgi:hypothetical protein
MTNEDLLTAIHGAAHANGLETAQQVQAVLTGSFATSIAIGKAGLTTDQLSELLTKGQVPAKVSALEREASKIQQEANAAAASFRDQIQAINEQIAALKSGV